jgi:hypothetical protein
MDTNVYHWYHGKLNVGHQTCRHHRPWVSLVSIEHVTSSFNTKWLANHSQVIITNSGFSQYKMVTAGVKDLSETVVYKFLVKGNDVKFLSYRMFKSFC